MDWVHPSDMSNLSCSKLLLCGLLLLGVNASCGNATGQAPTGGTGGEQTPTGGTGGEQPPTGGTGALTPADVTSVVLWLRPGPSLAISDGRAAAWMDSSKYGASLASVSPPTFDKVDGLEVPVFNGGTRLAVMANKADVPPQLALGRSDFMLTMVVKEDGPPPARAIVAAYGPHYDVFSGADFVTPNDLVQLEFRPLSVNLVLFGAPISLSIPRTPDGALHIVTVKRQGSNMTLTVDDETTVHAVAPTVDLVSQSLHLGNWDYDLRGFKGTIYEVVLLKDQALDDTAPIMDYFKERYGNGQPRLSAPPL